MKLILAFLLMTGSFAHALFALNGNGKTIVCSAGHSQTWVLNAERTTLQYTVGDKTLGPSHIFYMEDGQDITGKNIDVLYGSEEGYLTLGREMDTFQFAGTDSLVEISCK